MRQLADLAVWVGMIVLAVGVVYFTPIVAEYFTADTRPTFVQVVSRNGMRHTMLHASHPIGEPPPGR